MKRRPKRTEPTPPPPPSASDQLSLEWTAATRPKLRLRVALEDFLRERGVPYISVDEAKKALFSGAKLSSFHFVVYRPEGRNWLVWAAWWRRESREDLRQWEEIFGPGFVAVIASQAPDGTFRFRTLAGEAIELA